MFFKKETPQKFSQEQLDNWIPSTSGLNDNVRQNAAILNEEIKTIIEKEWSEDSYSEIFMERENPRSFVSQWEITGDCYTGVRYEVEIERGEIKLNLHTIPAIHKEIKEIMISLFSKEDSRLLHVKIIKLNDFNDMGTWVKASLGFKYSLKIKETKIAEIKSHTFHWGRERDIEFSDISEIKIYQRETELYQRECELEREKEKLRAEINWSEIPTNISVKEKD